MKEGKAGVGRGHDMLFWEAQVCELAGLAPEQVKWREGEVTGQFSPSLQRWRSKVLQARLSESCGQDLCACLVDPGRRWEHHGCTRT